MPVRTLPTGYIEWDKTLPLVHPDGSILTSISLSKKGQFILSIELDADELAELLIARLRVRPTETVASIGRAMTEASLSLGSVSVSDSLGAMGIDRSRSNGYL